MEILSNDTIERTSEAMFSSAFPCNPRPFANAINSGCANNGTAWIKTEQAKRIMWVLMGQCFGQMARIDLCDLWDELYKGKGEPCLKE